jgi:glucokinase
MSYSDLELCLYECFIKNQEIISGLNDLIKVVEYHQTMCNTVKTGGTAVSLLGTGTFLTSLLLAPVTGGLSLALGAVGGVLTIGGGVTNIITDSFDKDRSKQIFPDIERLVKTREVKILEVQKQIDQINCVVKDFVTKGASEETAIQIILEGN